MVARQAMNPDQGLGRRCPCLHIVLAGDVDEEIEQDGRVVKERAVLMLVRLNEQGNGLGHLKVRQPVFAD
jgi:hypothetical protein